MFPLSHLPAPSHYTPTFRSEKSFCRFLRLCSLWSLRFDGWSRVRRYGQYSCPPLYVIRCTHKLFEVRYWRCFTLGLISPSHFFAKATTVSDFVPSSCVLFHTERFLLSFELPLGLGRMPTCTWARLDILWGLFRGTPKCLSPDRIYDANYCSDLDGFLQSTSIRLRQRHSWRAYIMAYKMKSILRFPLNQIPHIAWPPWLP